MIYLVYALIDPETRDVVYVGTTRSPANRYANHWHDPAGAAYRWLRSIVASGLKPRVRIIRAGLPRREALRLQSEWIWRHRDTVLNRQIDVGALLSLGILEVARAREWLRERRG